jgi:uncharacterized membrane protein YhaH (DUF805 family)
MSLLAVLFTSAGRISRKQFWLMGMLPIWGLYLLSQILVWVFMPSNLREAMPILLLAFCALM